MTAENKAWEKLKTEYLKKVEKSLSSVKHPQMPEIIEDVRSHLHQRFLELSPENQTTKNFEKILSEMGDAQEYAELLDPNNIPTTNSKKNSSKKSVYIIAVCIILPIAILSTIIIHQQNKPLPKTNWHNANKLDLATRMNLGGYEKFYEENFHKNTGYNNASQKQKDKMIEKWKSQINGTDYTKAVLATAALGETGLKKAVPILTEIATTKGFDNRIKWIAVRGLAKIADRKTIPALISLIDHKNKNIRIYSKVALTEITGQFFGDSKEDWQKWWQENK